MESRLEAPERRQSTPYVPGGRGVRRTGRYDGTPRPHGDLLETTVVPLSTEGTSSLSGRLIVQRSLFTFRFNFRRKRTFKVESTAEARPSGSPRAPESEGRRRRWERPRRRRVFQCRDATEQPVDRTQVVTVTTSTLGRGPEPVNLGPPPSR